MKKITKDKLKKIAGGVDPVEAGVQTGFSAGGAAIGSALGPVGAVVGGAIGSGVGALVNGNKQEIAHALGTATETVATNYGKGHKDGKFTGMPMAFQKK